MDNVPLPSNDFETTNKVKRFIELARKIAEQSQYHQFKHGAVLVRGANIINTSCNKNGYNSFGKRFRKRDWGTATLHAEIGTILNIDRKNTIGTTMYCVRINRQGETRLSKPCHMCESVLRHCGIKKIIYSTDSGCAMLKL